MAAFILPHVGLVIETEEAASFFNDRDEPASSVKRLAVGDEKPLYAQKPVDPKRLAILAVQLKGKYQESTAALKELSVSLTAYRRAKVDLGPIIEPLFSLAGWGGIGRRNAWTAESILVWIGRPAVPLLNRRLKSDDAHDRRVATELLVRIGPPDASLVALLRPLLNDRYDEVRQAAIVGLVRIGPQDASLVALLRPFLNDRNDKVRQAAIDGLVVIGLPSKVAINDLERVAANDPLLVRRVRARSALIQVAGVSNKRILELAAFLKSKQAADEVCAACSRAATELGKLGPKAQIAEPMLLSALNHTHAQVRSSVAFALGKIGTNSPETIAALIDLLNNDPEREVRRSAAGSLGAIGPKAKGAVPALRKALKGDAQVGWWVAVDALCKIGSPGIVTILVEALANPDDGIRHASVKGLGNLGTRAKPAIVALEQSRQQDPREYIRVAAAEAIRKIEQAVKQ